MSQTPAQSPEDEQPALSAGAQEQPVVVSSDDVALKGQLETLLFITDHPLSLDDMRKLTKVKDAERLGAVVAELRRRLDESGSALQVLEVAGGFQMATRPVHGELVRKLFADKMTMRLSTAAHETLAIIAYKQPLTRAEIEEIRGVEVIAALETLLEKRLIKVVGRKESVGRPLLYGTTADFMRHFGLGSLEDMPPIESFSAPEAGLPQPPLPSADQAPAAEPEPEPEPQPRPEPAASAESSEPSPEAAPTRPPIWPDSEPAQDGD